MLVPLLQGLGKAPPEAMRDSLSQTHFAARAAERGVRSVPGWVLLWAVREALAGGRADLVEPVFQIRPGAMLYRILLDEGAFYPVVCDGVPATIYTQAQARKHRHGRRLRKRQTGCRMQARGT